MTHTDPTACQHPDGCDVTGPTVEATPAGLRCDAHDPVRTFTLGPIVTALAERGITAYVEQTGGGCATIFAGPADHDDHGNLVWAAAAGPGVYNWDDPAASTGHTFEWSVGADENGTDLVPDPSGYVTVPADHDDPVAWTVDAITARVAAATAARDGE